MSPLAEVWYLWHRDWIPSARRTALNLPRIIAVRVWVRWHKAWNWRRLK